MSVAELAANGSGILGGMLVFALAFGVLSMKRRSQSCPTDSEEVHRGDASVECVKDVATLWLAVDDIAVLSKTTDDAKVEVSRECFCKKAHHHLKSASVCRRL